MSKKLTVGCRARILTLKEESKHSYFSNETGWKKEYGGREVLLVERSGTEFSVILLGKGVTKLKKEDSNIVKGEMAWIPEFDMVWVDSKFTTNLAFIDWYQENEDNFCPYCGEWFPNRGGITENGKDCACPNCGHTE